MFDCQPINTLTEQNHDLEELSDQVLANKGRYQKLVSCLIYLSHTRLDLAYVVNVVSHFMQNPSEIHMNVVKFSRYLKSSH